MKELLVKNNNVTLCTENFGEAGRPAILLIMGATASMLWWDEEFCEQLASRGYFVIRYDNRDTGKSTIYESGSSAYDLVDLADDALHILDAYKIKQVHLVGMSLGGILSQITALKYPGLVLSLTLLATGPFGETDPNIPPMDDRIITFQKKADEIDWTDEDAVVSYLAGGAELLNGTKHSFDKNRSEILARAEFRRAINFRSMYNHAQLQGGENYFNRTAEITQPTLIIHGTADKIWNYNNALTLERTLPNVRLLTLDGVGHELHRLDWNLIIDAIARHTGQLD
ncbi:macrolide hydrolase EstT [Dyadobacter psychrotolerans]|uniref:Alpha/beta hydrolase n=1 Tax=Dyadobacter psychrotolerans TaxID=2541721 RepID=A0A4R5DX48_9BACT|nr:macrolide hydrolase EstT [Dyadobacter psychrotolerans]TDE15653.1 alpha/beta hydrolase [Dyadobacter psychrotolerans]